MRHDLAHHVTLAGSRSLRPRRRGGRGAFTLLEVIIAVGAVALVGVALAAVFEATGRTVTGGRRVAAFNAYAAMIENQMRADFRAMSRNGFLVVRNEYAAARNFNNLPDIPLSPDATTGARPRRIDQILFFAEGDFVSARQPVHPEFVARGKAARIYYGHGTRLMPDDPAYADPAPYDRHNLAPALGSPTPPGNPNYYAFDWTLLRHVTVLSSPLSAERPLPTPPLPGVTAANAADNDLQIALQPASSHIFRSLARVFPDTAVPTAWRSIYGTSERPLFRSGLIDIATTDLAEIRNIVMTASVSPNNVGNSFFDSSANVAPNEGNNQGLDGRFRPLGIDTSVLLRTHDWMLDAFPASPQGFRPDRPDQRMRMRYEPTPPSLLEVYRDFNGLELDYRRADQLMLSASNFLPHCTEFIVEWSFGETFPSDPNDPDYDDRVAGQHIWYGLPRRVDPSSTSNNPQDYYARPYGSGDVYWGEVSGSSYGRFIKRTPYRTRNGSTGQFPLDPAVVHGPNADIGNGGAIAEPVVTSFFGYVDPTFNPGNPVGGPGAAPDDLDGDGNPYNDTDDSTTGTIPWAWPTMFRVTLTLADPSDPTYEQTFQFVFDVPAERRN